MMTRYRIRGCMTALSLVSLLILAGCKTTGIPVAGKAVDSLAGHREAVEERLSTAATNAIAEGKTDEALALYEKLYTHPIGGVITPTNAGDADIALNYAQLLRKTGKASRALTVLAPLVEARPDKKELGPADPVLLNEYAAINIELGNFEKARTVLAQVLEDDKASTLHADAHNLQGVVFDAEGQHKEAEQAFRKALENWKGDTTSVMNNLGLCLASQGKFDESLTILRQALVMAPHKQGVARNIQMVTDLRKSVVPSAPTDLKRR